MSEVPTIELSHAIARVAIRVEALEFGFIALAKHVLDALPEQREAVLDAIEGYEGPGYSVVDGRRYEADPDHRRATAECAQKLARWIREA